jgi:hypothetical protein
LLNPELYNQGITRVCSTDNPGLGTDANANKEESDWKQVGYCDSTRIGCWLNVQNVKDAIKALNLEKDVLDEVSEESLEYLSGEFLDQATFYSKMEEIKAETDDTERISIINTILNAVYFNKQKANLYFWRGKSYSNLAINDYNDIVAARIAAGTGTSGTGTNGTTGTSGNNAVNSFNAKYLSPKIRLNDGNFLTSGDLCYRYFNSKWQFAVGCGNRVIWNNVATFKEDLESGKINEVTDKNRLIIEGLATKDGDYAGGLGWLIYKVLASTKGELSDQTFSITTMDGGDGIFEVKFPDVTYEPMRFVYYKYENNKWLWQLDDKFEGGGIWQSTSNVAPGFNEEQKMIVNALGKLDLNNGAVLLFDYSSEDIQELFETTTGTTPCTAESNSVFCNRLGKECGSVTANDNCGNTRTVSSCGTCTITGQTCNSVGKCVTGGTGLNELAQKILNSAQKFEKTIVPGDYNTHCSEAVSYIYKDASAGLSNCIYSAKSGKQYNIITSDGTSHTIALGTQKNSEGDIIWITADSCQFTSDNLAYADVLKKISPGDRIDIVFDEDSPHEVIFINWVAGQEYKTARIFDWNGIKVVEGATDVLGNTCTQKDFYSTTNRCKTYQYKSYDLNMDKHPVYRIWNPVAV